MIINDNKLIQFHCFIDYCKAPKLEERYFDWSVISYQGADKEMLGWFSPPPI